MFDDGSIVTVKAYIPKTLKRRAYAAFALQDTNFTQWTRQQLARWLKEQEAAATEPRDD